MRYMNNAGKEIQEARKVLHYKFRQACEGWNDSVQKKFEGQYMQPIDPQVRSIVNQVQALANLFAQAEREIP